MEDVKREKRSVKRMLAFALAFLTVVGGIVAYSPKELAAQAAGYVVVLDPGHIYHMEDNKTVGGLASGNVAADGTQEGTLNKQLAAQIAGQLKDRGYIVYSTLDIDVAGVQPLIQNSAPNISLKMRAAAAATVNADLFISVHHNSSGLGVPWDDAAGALVLWDSGQGAMSAKSKALATSVYNSVAALGYTVGNRKLTIWDTASDDGTSVIRYNSVPAMTLEAGFMTNQADLARCKDPNKQLAVAKQVAAGVAAFLSEHGAAKANDKNPPSIEQMKTSANPGVKPAFSVAAYGVKDETGVKGVEYKVYPTRQSRKAKIVKVANKGNGKWLATVDVKKLFGDVGGLYIVDVYTTDTVGNKAMVSRLRLQYNRDKTAPTLQEVRTSPTPSKKPGFSVAAYGVIDPSGVKGVQYKVYPTRQKSKAKMVTAKYKGGHKWLATVDIKKLFNGAGGLYIVDIYATDKKGNTGMIGRARLTYEKQSAASSYSIMGSSTVTAGQLRDYYVRTVGSSAYPYTKVTNLNNFCTMYVQECKRYGVKPEVAFAQMLLETNYLRFGGDVAAWQYNFAGIGATGGGVPGSDFTSIRLGIRAQVQHLYAYASTKALAGEQVDPRFQYVPRGSATTVGALSQKWATGADYGDKIMRIIDAIH